MTSENGGDVEDDGGFFEGERVLGCRLMCKGIEPRMTVVSNPAVNVRIRQLTLPGKGNLDMCFVDGEA